MLSKKHFPCKVKVKDGLEAYDTLGGYGIDSNCDDDNIYVAIFQYKQAVQILQKYNLIIKEKI